MRFFLTFFATLCLLNKPAWSDDNKRVKVGELLCNTKLEKMIYHDGSGDDYFRLSDEPIRSAKTPEDFLALTPSMQKWVSLNKPELMSELSARGLLGDRWKGWLIEKA